MTITNCPKCGSFNITTAGVCENCGWSPFAQVALCTRITGEMELKVSGKALLDDYKRLLFENRNLTARIAELEMKIRHNALWQASEDAEERAHLEKLVPDLKKRIAELEAVVDELVNIGDNLFDSLNPIAWKHEWLDKWWKLSSCRRGERE